MEDGVEGVSTVVGTVCHILGGVGEKGGRGSYIFRVGFGFGRIGVKWSEWVKWIGEDWSGRVNAPRMKMGRN